MLCVVIGVLALMSVRHGYDAWGMLTSDALYAFQLLETPFLEYRPPPPNRIFPDVLVHAMVYPWHGTLLQQKIIAGAIIFLASSLLIGLYKGRRAFACYLAITVCWGFGFLNTGYHYSLPLTLLVYQLARRTRADLPVLFLVVFSDVLLLMPLALWLARSEERDDLRRVTATCLVAVAAGVWYSEFSEAIADFALVLPPFCIAALLANRLGLLRAMTMACCLLLPLGTMAGIVPARYGIPVASTVLLLLFDTQRPRFDWRYIIAPLVIIGIFVMTVDRAHSDRLQADYRCLVDTLTSRGAGAVAVEYWTARPLYYAARQAGKPLTITQTDFRENDSDAFMAPYAFYGEPTHWAVRNLDTCASYERGPKSCNQQGVGKVLEREAVCNAFELYRYEETIPREYLPPPGSKSESIARHLGIYVRKTIERLHRLTSGRV